MGRKKIVIKRLAEDRNRNVTFLKRKAGLMKKAWELSVLCGAEVSVIVFNSAGKLFEFSSADSVEKAIDRYHAYAGPVERRKPEEFAAQQASGGGDNSDEDEDLPAASGTGTNSGGAPITASGNMSLRGRDEWKEVTMPSYDHLSSPIDSGSKSHRRSSRDGGKAADIGPVDPRLYNRMGNGMSAGPFHPDHDAALANYRMHARDSEDIMEQQRRAEQYRYMQMQAQLSNGFPPYPGHGNLPGHLSMGSNAPPSWMGLGRNRQRSDIGDLDSARGEQLTSWAALRDTRTPSVNSMPINNGSQPALNALYSQRINGNAPGQISPGGSSLPPAGGSDTASIGLPTGQRHGLPEENVSAGEFADPSINSGLDFYTPYHLPTAQGMNQDGTLDWQRTAAAAQLQAALQTQQAQLAYLRQQKAQQMQWKDLVAASGMDYAVNHFGGRMGDQQNDGPGIDNGQYTSQTGITFQPSAATDSGSGGSTSAAPQGDFLWPTEGQGNSSGQAGSWFNNLNQQPSSLRTNIRIPGSGSPIRMNGAGARGSSGDPNIRADHANAEWTLNSEAHVNGDANSVQGERSSMGASQDDLKAAGMAADRKRQYEGDASDLEADGKRNRAS
ncbi:hypothetical protein NliqN6_0330 [Naganishia liquefaciens]|uniref:MADS-box domain-containing protein n=1 Tax=Naganishia liquefaciens TaxID=104408 RepID=A0A8H3TNB4_9TREE|nr:hypothetical protein NliqN6_0330 [Naganishia liquefaciens]